VKESKKESSILAKEASHQARPASGLFSKELRRLDYVRFKIGRIVVFTRRGEEREGKIDRDGISAVTLSCDLIHPTNQRSGHPAPL
jgi:hypothetical protein